MKLRCMMGLSILKAFRFYNSRLGIISPDQDTWTMATVPPLSTTPRFPFLSRLLPIPWYTLGWVLLIFSILISRVYLALIRPIMFFDESLYLAQTLAVHDYGVMVPWAWNPGVAYLNALWYMPFNKLPLGLDYASRLATFFSSTLTFVLMITLVRNWVRERYWPMLLVVIALASPPFWNLILNSSDNYYMVFVLLFMAMISYSFPLAPSHWSWVVTASILAFSATLRNDGTIVYGATTLVYLWRLWRFPANLGERLLILFRVWALPMLMVLGVYWWIALTQGGFYDAFYDIMKPEGTTGGERTYVAFEQGEGRIQRFEIEAEGKVWWRDGITMARERYGTPEKNNYGVFRAILNNPNAWLQRITLNIRDFFLTWQSAFWNHGTALFVTGVWGLGLLWRNKPKVALTFLLAFAPTTFFFLLTYWQERYVVTLAPLIVMLAIYALSVFAQPPEPSERRWGIGLALISGVAIALFYYFGITYRPMVPIHALVVTLSLYALFLWRFVFQQGVVGYKQRWLTGIVFLLLAYGSLRLPPYANLVTIPYSYETRDYITHAYTQVPNARVCLAYQDLDALSLVWYARQTPVLASVDIKADLLNGSLPITMSANQCDYALIAYTGWTDPTTIGVLDVFYNSAARIQFISDGAAIILFELDDSVSGGQ
jgi:hypothetical protein